MVGICMGVAVETEEEVVVLCVGRSHEIRFGRCAQVLPRICPLAAAAGSQSGSTYKGEREKERCRWRSSLASRGDGSRASRQGRN